MSPSESPIDRLPMRWVERIFARLAVRYGRPFLARWDGLSMADVHADWADVLRGLDRRPSAIAYALEHLPIDRPPTAGEFRALCNACPQEPIPEVPAPPADPARVAAATAACRGSRPQILGARAWAERLRARELAGEHLSPYSCNAWRVALRVVPSDTIPMGSGA